MSVTWKPIVVWTGSTAHVPLGMTSLLVVIDFFVDGLEEDPSRLLDMMQEFGDDVRSSMAIYELDWPR